jgi:hypothetical protein
MEVETRIIVAQEQAYCSDEEAEALLGLAAEVGRLINGLANSLKNNVRNCPLPTDH